VRLREKEHLKAIPTDAHRGTVALAWEKPKTFKTDFAYVMPQYSLNEAIRRIIDTTGEFGNWRTCSKPKAIGGDLVAVTFEVNDSYTITFFLTKTQWADHSAPKE
jgi:hypothetical protein